VVGEAIQQRAQAGGVGEHGVPFGEDEVGRDVQRAALVAAVDDFEEQVRGAVVVVGEISDLVDTEQVGTSIERLS
jgi:hypothetical protein